MLTYKSVRIVTMFGPTREVLSFENVGISVANETIEVTWPSGRVVGFPLRRVHTYELEPAS